MLLAQSVGIADILVILVYLLVTAYLGWLGYRQTKNAADYLVGGRATHPFIMAFSYGATFISTSAIVGFGGLAGNFGMSLLWLAFLNIAVGIFIAFVVFGAPTRRMGHALGAHTFPEFLGRRYDSKAVHVFAGAVIFFFMPLYASAVLTGGSKYTALQFGCSYEMALLLFAVITAAYVIAGGLKAVMYTDTFQGVIMVVGMLVLLGYTYAQVGGVTAGHQYLSDMKDLVPAPLQAIGHQGWTEMPAFGWGSPKYNLWWIIISAITIGVGIGVLAQPSLIVRFMTVKSRRDLNRAVPMGAVFILIMVGVPYAAGSLSNAYFAQHGDLFTGRVAQTMPGNPTHVMLELWKPGDTGAWAPVPDPKADPKKPASERTTRVPAVLDPAKSVAAKDAAGNPVTLLQGRSLSIVYAKGNFENIMPAFINHALPRWFGMLFFLTLLAAAMSTLSSQFHTLGSSAGRDLYEQLTTSGRPRAPSLVVIRIAIMAGLIAAVTISWSIRNEELIARFTAIFFGLCAATFLPAYVGGLFVKRMTTAGALASMAVGFVASVSWLLLIKGKEAGAIGLVQKLTGGKTSLLWDKPNWPEVDPVLIALPLSILTAVLVSLATKPPAPAHLAVCFGGEQPAPAPRPGASRPA